jgi:DNA-binding SARP family transcriptional activator/tetratricopeptide (TPR) repeat protein
VLDRAGDAAVEFRVLGPVEALVDGRPVDLGPAKRQLLLALLAMECGRCLPLDRLIELVWEEPPPTARRVVFAHIARLRKALAGAAGRGADLVSTPPGYTLRTDPDRVDAHLFRRLVDTARNTTEPAARTALYRDALALWHGPVLAGLTAAPGASQLFQGIEDLRLVATEERIEADLSAGRHDAVLGELADLVARHPLRERLAGHFMLALYRCGRTAEALDAYRRTRAHLAAELGVDTGPELNALQAAILHRDPALKEPPAAAVAAPIAPAATAIPETVPCTLPRDVAGFTGRADQLQRLIDLIPAEGGALLPAEGTAPVVAVTGLAGTGKTTLAVHWAYRVADRFPGGQFYLDLSGYRDDGTAGATRPLAVLLRALGVPPDQIPVAANDAATLYRSLLAGRRILVLLDNAVSAAQVRPLLPAGPGCMSLVISRSRLDGLIALDRAYHFPLGVFTQSEAVALLTTFVGERRVADQPDSAVHISHLCGRLPLALAIVGAQLTADPTRGLGEHAAVLSGRDRLSMLAIEDDDRAEVRAAFTDSYLGLPVELRTAFRRLSVHPGRTLGPESGAALMDTDEPRGGEWMKRLVRFHMIELVGTDRYAFHDLLRLFARERAAQEGDDAEATRRMSDWYVHAVDAAARVLHPQLLRLEVPAAPAGVRVPGFDTAEAAREWLDRERDNIVAVIDHVAGGPAPEAAWLLADAMRGYLQSGGYLADMLAVSQTAMRAARDAPDRVRATTHLSLANAYRGHGDVSNAIHHYRSGLELSGRAGWVDGEAAAHGSLGNLSLQRGDLDLAAHHYEQSNLLFGRTGHRGGQATSLSNLGSVHRMQGRLTEAAAAHAEAVALHRAAGARGGEALALANLGVAHHDRGQLDQALRELQDALAIFRQLGERPGEAGTLEAIAAVHRDAGRIKEALAFADAALELARTIAYRRTEADVLNVIGDVKRATGAHRDAVGLHHEALLLARQYEVKHPRAEVNALLGLAAAHHAGGADTTAVGYAREAVEVARRQHDRSFAAKAEAAAATLAGATPTGPALHLTR